MSEERPPREGHLELDYENEAWVRKVYPNNFICFTRAVRDEIRIYRRIGKWYGRFSRYVERELPYKVEMTLPFWMHPLAEYVDRHIAVINEQTGGKWCIDFEDIRNRLPNSFLVTYSFDNVRDATIFNLITMEDRIVD